MKRVLLLVLMTIYITSCWSLEISPAILEGPTKNPIGCEKRMYTYRVSQTDDNGKECWDDISVVSCWGRCDSNEISDWKFPYKKSHHPVCVHSIRNKIITELRNCEPGASPEAKRYEYLEAIECQCQICSSSDTSCEAPSIRLGSSDVSPKVMQLHGIGDELEY